MKTLLMVREELSTVALGTSKINYLDPRISVAWCKQYEARRPPLCSQAFSLFPVPLADGLSICSGSSIAPPPGLPSGSPPKE